jgi:hypothetical protein
MPQKARITVYLQALGAHYLGKNAYDGKDIAIRFSNSCADPISVPYIIGANSNDGINSPTFAAGSSSFMPVITVPPLPKTPSVDFITRDVYTVCGNANFDLPDKIEFGNLDVSIPTSAGSPIAVRYQVLLNPEKLDYIITVVVPGLYLSQGQITGNTISVYVKMMCGCPVDTVTPGLWQPNDFAVAANVLDTSGGTSTYQLTYANPQPTNSLFSATLLPNHNPIKSVTFTAMQISTGNYGVLVSNQ